MRRLRQTTTLELSPEATNLERLIAQIPQGRSICISYVRVISLEDERFLNFIRDYDSNKRQDLGKLCDTHGIKHADFLAQIIKEAFPVVDEAMKLSHLISTGVVAKRLPRVVERGMIEAAKSDGVADRHFILQKQGFHVAPKGVSINMNQVNAGNGGLPNFEDETRALSDILSESVDGQLIEDVQLTEGDDDDYVEIEETELEKELVER